MYLVAFDMQSIEMVMNREINLSFYLYFDELLTFCLFVILHVLIFNMQNAREFKIYANLPYSSQQ